VEVGEIALPIHVAGYFEIDLIRGGIIVGHWEFSNLLTNGFLNLMFSTTQGAWLFNAAWLAVGTGSTAPAVGQNTLAAEIARTNSDGGSAWTTNYVVGPPEYWEAVHTRVFIESQANGNITELGFFNASSTGTMMNRQLILDALGSPTSITKTNQDQLRVTFRNRVMIPAADVPGTIVMTGGVGGSYDYVVRPVRTIFGSQVGWGSLVDYNTGFNQANNVLAFESNALLARSSSGNTGTTAVAQVASMAAYVADNFYNDFTYQFDPGFANFATGIGSIQEFPVYNDISFSRNLYQVAFTPTKVPKTNTRRLIVTFRRSVARV
jgi:hypothetical protein